MLHGREFYNTPANILLESLERDFLHFKQLVHWKVEEIEKRIDKLKKATHVHKTPNV